MSSHQSAILVFGITAWLATSTHAAFVAQPDGSLLEDFNGGVVDTVTWTSNTLDNAIVVSETGTELKIIQTFGFNGAYSTFDNGIDETTGMSDGSGNSICGSDGTPGSTLGGLRSGRSRSSRLFPGGWSDR